MDFKGTKIKCTMGAFCFLTKDKIYEVLDYKIVVGLHMFLIKGDNGDCGWCTGIHFDIGEL